MYPESGSNAHRFDGMGPGSSPFCKILFGGQIGASSKPERTFFKYLRWLRLRLESPKRHHLCHDRAVPPPPGLPADYWPMRIVIAVAAIDDFPVSAISLARATACAICGRASSHAPSAQR